MGGSGADTLNSGDSGSVKLKGNGGSDTFNITTDQASTVEDLSGSDVLKVASGSGNVTATVTADFTATAASTNNLSLAGVTLVATDNAKITLTSAGNNYGYTVTGQSANPDGNGSSVVGSAKGDAITGGANNGKDTFVGGAGDDVLTGNGGTDHLTGGTGDDTFAFTDDLDANDTIAGGVETGDKITVSAGGGNVTGTLDLDNVSGVLTVEASGANITELVISPIAETTGQTLTISQTHATGVLKVNNDAASTSTVFDITGSAGADSIEGSKGADTITGGKGADTIAGGEGNDRIVLTEGTAAADVVQIRAPGSSANIDTIIGFAAKTGADVFNASAAATFLNGGTVAATNVTATNTAGSANDNVLILDVDVADLQFDNAAALVADTNTIGEGIAGADATALVLYGFASAPGETRVAIAVVDNAGSFNSATDIAILKAVKSENNTFATNDFVLA